MYDKMSRFMVLPRPVSHSFSYGAYSSGVIFILLTYVGIDILLHHMDTSPTMAQIVPLQGHQNSLELPTDSQELAYEACQTVEGHLGKLRGREDPWNQMKWIGRPSPCKVNGHLIESIDTEYNFRRGFSLRFARSVEDKKHLLPWLLGSRIDLNQRSRRVYLDLGANSFTTSILWFMTMYPCDFTEVHTFEIDEKLLKLPLQSSFREDTNWIFDSPNSINVKIRPSVPRWMLDRIKIYNHFVADHDNATSNAINITRFVKDELKLTSSDAVVIKMDIEGSEWSILNSWLQDPAMAHIVDELFVEIHYHHPSMSQYSWDSFAGHTREDAARLLAQLRVNGFFTHAWPWLSISQVDAFYLCKYTFLFGALITWGPSHELP